MSRMLIVGCFLLLVPLLPLSSAEGQQPVQWQDQVFPILHFVARPGDSVGAARDKALHRFRTTDIDGGGVSETDYVLKKQLRFANQRARYVSNWLQRDLDGDGEVTRRELEAAFGKAARRPIRSDGVEISPTEEQVAEKLEVKVREALKDDKNKDGVVSFSETIAAANAESPMEKHVEYHTISLSLDKDGDGAVSEAEFTEAIDHNLGIIDRDSDGLLTSQEISAFRESIKQVMKVLQANERARKRDAQNRAMVESCRFPQASEGVQVVLLGTHRGKALSSVTLGGDDAIVSVADVWIEPGDQPLYVLLASRHPLIWRFTGAVERVEVVVAGSQKTDATGAVRVGVVGVPAALVHVPPGTNCMSPFVNASSTPTLKMTKTLGRLIGREPDVVKASARVSAVSFPTGLLDRTVAYADTRELPEDGPVGELWRDLLFDYPGGLVQLDANAVVSPAAARPYVTLPHEAGLAQLVEQGTLEVLDRREVVYLNGTRIYLGGGRDTIVAPEGVQPRVSLVPHRFLITKKVTLPVGLRSGLEFVLAPGVPGPEGLGSLRLIVQ